MISNTTPAGAPTNVVNSEQAALQLFGPRSASQTSAEFTVDQHPFVLSAYNLGADDVILVQQVVFQGASKIASSYQPVYGVLQLDQHRSKATIELPGRYQLHHTGSSSLGTFTVLGAAYSSTASGISELAAALQAVITNVNNSVVGTSPVVVTGAGTPADPFDVTTPDIVVEAIASFNVIVGHGASDGGTGTAVVCLGADSTASGPNSIAVGPLSTCSDDGVAIGSNAVATGFGSTAIGRSANSGLGAVAVGEAAVCGGNFSIAAGSNSETHSNYCIAIGANAGKGDTHVDTVIIATKSTNTVSSQDHQIVLGTSTNTQLVTAGSVIQGGVISASDERLKKNLEAEHDALMNLDKLSPVTFDWNAENVQKFNAVLLESELSKRQHGLIAQEVEEVFPEFVETMDRGGGAYLLLRYERFIPVLIAAVQELNQKIEVLEAKLEDKQNG